MKNDFSIGTHLLEKIREYVDAGKTPFYIYNTNGIRKNCMEFLSIPYEPISVHYAMMANSNPHFLNIVKKAGLKIFVNSLSHLDLAINLKFRGDEIIYAASAMDETAMRRIKSSKARLILDSIGQIDLWETLFPDEPIGIRCNIGEQVVPKETSGGYFIGKKSRLGIDPDTIAALKGKSIISGLHTYVGTNISEIDYFLECYSQVLKLVELFPNLEYIDLGGGFGSGEGMEKRFDISTYSLKVAELMNHLCSVLNRKIRLILEPGRIIGGDAGYFVCQITDIKMRNNKQMIGVNASSAQFPRPLFYPDVAVHPVKIISKSNSASDVITRMSSIYGCSTYSRDYLSQDIELPGANIGDMVVFGHAGSYCSSAHTDFLGFPKADEYFI